MRGHASAARTAVHDQQHAPSVISISWGGPESSWTAQAMNAFDAAFDDANALASAFKLGVANGSVPPRVMLPVAMPEPAGVTETPEGVWSSIRRLFPRTAFKRSG